MQLVNNYFIIENAVPDRFCNYILEYGKNLKEKVATIAGADEKQKEELEKTRKSNDVWLSEKWLYREIQPLINEANTQAGWNFQWDNT